MIIKSWDLVILVIMLFSTCFHSTISLPSEMKSSKRRNLEEPAHTVSKNREYPYSKENSSKEIDDDDYQVLLNNSKKTIDTRNSHRRSARQNNEPNRKTEPPFSLEEFQNLLKRYLDLFPQLKGSQIKNGNNDDKLGSHTKDLDSPGSQNGNVNVYVKGNIHIKGSIHINTNGNGNGMKNMLDPGQKTHDSDTIEVISPDEEIDNSDVVTIPRNQYGKKILPRRTAPRYKLTMLTPTENIPKAKR